MPEQQRYNVLITGASGCVGHYLYDVLSEDPRYHLYLLVRSPEKIKFNYKDKENVTIVKEDLTKIHKNKELLKKIDYLIHVATNWGGYKEPWQVNVIASWRLFNALDEKRIKKIIYFSTASIIDRDHKPVARIREIGTNYIRSKFLLHKMLPKSKHYQKIITLFPTWVFGGDSKHPFSHAAEGLREIDKKIGWLRFIKFRFSFHFIHALDIAKMTKYMLENEMTENEYVLGNELMTIGRFLKEAGAYFKKRTPFQFYFSLRAIIAFAKLFGKKLHPWDEYCIKYRHFAFETLNCRKLELDTNVDTVGGLISSISS